jgi:hypothetical protein
MEFDPNGTFGVDVNGCPIKLSFGGEFWKSIDSSFNSQLDGIDSILDDEFDSLLDDEY